MDVERGTHLQKLWQHLSLARGGFAKLKHIAHLSSAARAVVHSASVIRWGAGDNNRHRACSKTTQTPVLRQPFRI